MAEIKRIDNATIQISSKYTSGASHPRLAKHSKKGKPSGNMDGKVYRDNFRKVFDHKEESGRKEDDHKKEVIKYKNKIAEDARKKAEEAAKKKKEEDKKKEKPKPQYSAKYLDWVQRELGKVSPAVLADPKVQQKYTSVTGQKP